MDLSTNRIKLLLGGVLTGLIGGGIAVFAAGGGHGSFTPATILFPYSMLSTVGGEPISILYVGLALLQYPIYGIVLSIEAKFLDRKLITYSLLSIHLVVVISAFHYRGEQF